VCWTLESHVCCSRSTKVCPFLVDWRLLRTRCTEAHTSATHDNTLQLCATCWPVAGSQDHCVAIYCVRPPACCSSAWRCGGNAHPQVCFHVSATVNLLLHAIEHGLRMQCVSCMKCVFTTAEILSPLCTGSHKYMFWHLPWLTVCRRPQGSG
jgi:hypothetical protein